MKASESRIRKLSQVGTRRKQWQTFVFTQALMTNDTLINEGPEFPLLNSQMKYDLMP